MTDDATIRGSMQIRKGTDPVLLDYISRPTAFTADVTGTKGPSPGAITVATAPGTDVDLSELTTPALCRIMNLDDENFVEVGIWDPEISTFYPIDEILPGETYIRRLSRNLAQEYGTGTGTTGAETNRLRLRADTAACDVLIEAFEA